ncbi:MAG: Coenzyme F420 hydrogenase/dehydrogenase, beta subunit C-terminal domain [Bacteroides sp.]|nr:Coenzyme F420 hydrogenase/dehydrogenase, beta subunit C-terminal domain [Bacteroides sp.]MCM1379908.1 Coenzyme F420 hydrogenase/dehydrogenase, beta subunit C-terminal domain [Bacteroides sp.]MCM1446238.1 Coenzyme F420 hydrogenase/dehydrogenase, beta subunit C-terminal domain [Prevotella sp.]
MNDSRGYLVDGQKSGCTGCEACVQICPKAALQMSEDAEGFRYPQLDESLCINCGLCHKVCPEEKLSEKNPEATAVFGGYNLDSQVKAQSTSGGAFSAIVEAWCEENYAIFGATDYELNVLHTYITEKSEINIFRKSKYSQSLMGNAYVDARALLRRNVNVLFSGTPCQIAGLYKYLATSRTDTSRLLTVEVVCEGVPSPLYIRKFNLHMERRYGSQIAELNYRYKTPGKWDFQVQRVKLENGRAFLTDRWFNPFWSIWLNHLMSRPSCYRCPFTTPQRVADITLGDLWGVHLYCPELYGKNGGASLIFANSARGLEALKKAEPLMFGHRLDFNAALRYQGPMKRPIAENPLRAECMADLESESMTYSQINRKWAKRPSLKLLYKKYIWGNRQKVAWWNLKNKIFRK